MSKLMIIDGNSILNRAFYGLQGRNMLETSDGLYTNAIFGFINILNKYIEEEKPQYISVAFDLKAPTFRHKEFDAYKANRKGMPRELAMQLPVMKEVLDAMNIKRLECEGFEADDILGSLSKQAEEKGFDVIIITGDKDSLQLASKKTRIKIPTTKAGKTETNEYNDDAVFEKYGVTPLQFIDVKGLMGDTSDNIPGVAGIGEKTALGLIQQFGSIENIYENIDLIDKKSVKEKLILGKDMAFRSKWLATIHRDMDCMCSIEDLEFLAPDSNKLLELFKRLEFKSLITKYGLDKENEASIEANVSEYLEMSIVESESCFDKYLEELKNAVDLSIYCLYESKGHDKVLTGISITEPDTKRTTYIDAYSIGEKAVVEGLKPIFEDNAIYKYCYDAKNLYLYLMIKDIKLKALKFDTMIAAYLLDPSNTNYSLDRLSEQYLSKSISSEEALIGKGKGAIKYSDLEVSKRAEFAAVNSNIINDLYKVLNNAIIETDQTDLYFEIELPLTEVLASMEYHGFKVDVNMLVEYSRELDDKISVLENDIIELAGEAFNINSPKQLGIILFEKLELPVIKKTKTGYSTDIEVLEQLKDKHCVVEKIIEYRQLVKLKSTYVEGLMAVINPNTGKIHSSFNQTVTTTGRISSTEPNLQNIPIKLEMGRKIRKVFIPTSDEFVLLDADYSQIELRVLAHIANDANMIDAFINGADIHTATASQIFNVPPSEVTSFMRSSAKAVNFGIVYGIGDFSLSKDLGVTRKEARKYIDGYLDRYPGVREYMSKIVHEGKERGYVTTMFKRRRYLPELKSSNFNIRSFGERIAMNTPIQGSAADIIKIAMVSVYNALKDGQFKSRLILQVHDELIIETYHEEINEVKKILKECMEKAANLNAPLTADVNSGSNWYESK